MAEHTVKAFDTDLEGLRRGISEMGGIAEKMLADASSALVEHDTVLAQAVIAADNRLDIPLQHVEATVGRNDGLSQGSIMVDERGTRVRQHLLGDAAHLGDAAAQAFQVSIEGPDGMLLHGSGLA